MKASLKCREIFSYQTIIVCMTGRQLITSSQTDRRTHTVTVQSAVLSSLISQIAVTELIRRLSVATTLQARIEEYLQQI